MKQVANLATCAVVLVVCACLWAISGPVGVALFITTSAAMTAGAV